MGGNSGTGAEAAGSFGSAADIAMHVAASADPVGAAGCSSSSAECLAEHSRNVSFRDDFENRQLTPPLVVKDVKPRDL